MNTNAKNLVFYDKSKGGEKLHAFDIKNIYGRAGIYYHHFVGRIFYLEREVYETLSAPDPSLDYATFGDAGIGYMDLDNAELADLSDVNRRRKQEREELINSYGIPASVFRQNRLVDRLKQLNLIVTIKRLGAEGVRRFVSDCSSIRDFLRSGVIYRILELLSQVGIVNDYDVARFGKIVLEYVKPDGWQRLMIYQLGQSGSVGDDAIDSAYTRVFTDISNIVEYRIPMLRSVFSNILSYVCGTLNISSESLALDAAVQVFEFGGVSTELGVTLADGGFPLRTVRLLEQQQPGLMILPVVEFLQRLMALDSQLTILLDKYEIILIREILS